MSVVVISGGECPAEKPDGNVVWQAPDSDCLYKWSDKNGKWYLYYGNGIFYDEDYEYNGLTW
ncbi:hypothetical protein [Neisseria animalis]|uniref:Uncharacterized protein n=1 Tax=Neisseria animalis TaxID=492 RepID=A0A5P3MT52_NEIAN|nr:hypothetical protein [Neisseria animalis]QEY24796.1 hypothetical protein D0T90_10220 [Neisseria animalis]ROW31534.1 hypothetical protein CGZ60_09780 [Neisseria animalis]VEE07693.1 Uncharacterised protein [Neisseria animalis]